MLQYEILGSGKPLVLLHGFLESKTMWRFLDLKQLNRQCILVDLPGHGESDLTDESEPSMRFMASEVEKVLLFLNIDACDIVGHSMGGYVALELMQSFSKVDQLILLNSNFWADSEQKKQSRLQVAEVVWKAKSLLIQTAIPNLFWDKKQYNKEIEVLINEANSISPFAIAYSALAMRTRRDYTDFVVQNSESITIIQGENDETVPLNEMLNLVTDNIDLEVIKYCGHMSHIEQSEEVLRLIKAVF